MSATVTENKIISLPVEWPYRMFLNALILFIITTLAFITVMIKTDFVSSQIKNAADELFAYTGRFGLNIEDITIKGRDKTNLQEIIDTIQLNRGDNILSVNVKELKQNLETLPWIKTVEVRRSFFPNNVYISIIEREIKSLWQIDNHFYPIDGDGNVINAETKISKPLLLIVGHKAPENSKKLFDILQEDESVYNRIKVANFISGRRWNLILDDVKDGVTIKLPEDNIDIAWKKLLNLNNTYGLLKRKLTIIDLRLPDKVIVKLKKTEKIDPNAKESKI